MSELQENTPATEPAIVAEPTTEPVATDPSKPAGYDPIDPATSTPEQTQERLNYLYGQVKHSEREKREMKQILSDQSRLISELSQGQQAVVNHLQEKNFTDNESSIRLQMRTAWDKGDNDTYFALQDKLDEIRIDKKLAARTKPQESQQPKNAVNYAQTAQGTGELTQAEFDATDAWQNERDESGGLVRPWAFGDNANHQAALREAAAIFNNPRYATLSYDGKLAEIDKRMGISKRAVGQTVMGGNLTIPGKQTKLTLTPKQQEIAIKTKYAGNGKTEAEHLEAYRKQIANVKQRRQ
jgi:hypothetical protein